MVVRGFVVLGFSLIASVAACGGSKSSSASPPRDGGAAQTEAESGLESLASCGDDDAGEPLDASTEAECQKTSLRISPSGTVATPDRSPFNPTLAANPLGDTFLAAWIDVPLPGSIWASVLGRPCGGIASSRATQVAPSSSCNPVAAWTGNGFAVAWGSATEMMVQRLDSGGAIVGSPMSVASRSAGACPDSLVAVGDDLVLEWTEGPQIQEGGAGQWFEYAALIGPDGLAQSPVLINSLGAGGATSLAVLGGVPYAAYTQIQPSSNASAVFVSEVQWSSPPAPISIGPGNLLAFFPAGPQRLATLVPYGSAMALYETDGGGLESVAQVDDNLFAAAADACGRIVGLATDGQSLGSAGAAGPIFAETIAGPPSQVTVSADFNEIVLLGAGSTFGVLWVEGGSGEGTFGPYTLRFATLTWQ